jgi:NADH dehydrogenase FAD-containing subunit
MPGVSALGRQSMRESNPRVVIVGGGFGGLAATKALRNTPAKVILIDRTNHHLFQPLLYQVATSVLSPSQIGFPIRAILGNQKNTTVILGEVTGVDTDKKCVFVSDADRLHAPLTYDYLILATGATHSYFGRNEFEKFAPGLKSLADAVATRNKVLQAFELAEAEEDPSRHRDLLTFVLVGAGPTGVEMAGALAVLYKPHSNQISAGSILHPPGLCSPIWGREFWGVSQNTSLKPRSNDSKVWVSRFGSDMAWIRSTRTAWWSQGSASSARP